LSARRSNAHTFGVDDHRFDRERAQQISDRPEARREDLSLLAENRDVGAHLVELGSVAVEFGLVQPAVAGGNCLGGDGATGWNEAELGHSFWM